MTDLGLKAGGSNPWKDSEQGVIPALPMAFCVNRTAELLNAGYTFLG